MPLLCFDLMVDLIYDTGGDDAFVEIIILMKRMHLQLMTR